jgi:ABC-type nitrate/sulfonate/bicarbonate transport system substrate-binding protein
VRAAYYLPIFVLVNQRILERRGYVVELRPLYERNTDMINDFTAGRIDVTAQSCLTMFPLEARYPNRFKFIYGQNNKSYFFLVPPNSPIQSLGDLAGKTVATWTSPTAYLSIPLILRPLIGDPSQVKVNRVDVSSLNQVLADKQADAVFSTDVFISRAIRQGWGRYVTKTPPLEGVENPFFNGGGLINPKLAADEPRVASDIQAAFDEAISFIQSKPEQARALIPKYLKDVSNEDAERAPLDEFVPIAGVDMESAQRIADRLFKEGDLDRRIDVRHLFFVQK